MNDSKFSALVVKEEAAEKSREAGNVEFKRGDFAAAVKQYDKSIELNATVAAYANRAQVHLCLGSYDNAIRDAQSALNMDPAHLKSRFRLGRAFFFKKMFEKSMKHYQKCLEQEPNNVQVLQAIEQCEQAMCIPTDAGEPTPTSTGSPNVVPPGFLFEFVQIGPNCFEFIQVLNALAKARPLGPIAQIQLFDMDLGTVYQFFKSLDLKMLEGGSLEIQNVHGDDHAFCQFIRLFKPKRVIISGNQKCSWDFDAHFRCLEPIRDAKMLSFTPPFCPMVDYQVSQQTVLDWLHSPLASPSHCSPTWSPPKPAAKASLMDVLHSHTTDQLKLNPCVNLTNVWRHPAAKILNIGEDLLFNDHQNKGANVMDTFIDQCHKLFRLATRPLNYSVKLIRKIDVTKPPLLPRAFTNTLGEQLRVSIQSVEKGEFEDFIVSLQSTRGPLPPHDMVIIERFHTSA